MTEILYSALDLFSSMVLVDSTQRAVDVGDEQWSDLLGVHDQAVRRCIGPGREHGRENHGSRRVSD